ncbi:MAG: hypothetical protein LBC09_03800 [Helicobacteraceae bacterium]|jgi:hypothetical protein|nr:hypothetical protein [Helicobacteraceae bacterium]
MTQDNLDAIIEAKLKERQEARSYHKRSRLLTLKSGVAKMLAGNLSVRDQLEILGEVGVTVSDRAYREFLAREFGEVYDDFLKRNGWVRKKRQRGSND